MGTTKSLLIFAVGIVMGIAVTGKYFKTKYEKIADKEIESVKERFTDKMSAKASDDIIGSGKPCQTDSAVNEEKMDIHIITPDDFGEYDDYVVLSYTLYADGIITDEDDDPLSKEDTEKIIFCCEGEPDGDTFFLRDDKIKCDYEILLDRRGYTELNEV